MRLLLSTALILAACGSGTPSRQHVQREHLGYDAPRDWHRTDTNERGVVTSVWVPEENSQKKESITVIRSERSPAVAKAGAPVLERLLAGAQPPGSRSSVPQRITTSEHLAGARIELDFVPVGLKTSYHRVHAVLVDGTALINVFYTALSADGDLEAFNLVLDSIRHEES